MRFREGSMRLPDASILVRHGHGDCRFGRYIYVHAYRWLLSKVPQQPLLWTHDGCRPYTATSSHGGLAIV